METIKRLNNLMQFACTGICSFYNAASAEVTGAVSGELKRRTTTTKEATPEFSQDLVLEILLRLPVKSLVRFNSVCKHWYELIRSPNFIVAHYKITSLRKKVSIFYCGDDHSYLDPVSIRFFDVAVELPIPPRCLPQLVGCYNGLVCLCLSPDYHHKFALWNPATTQSRIIPTTGLNLITFANYYSGLCFDSVANTHKILRIRFFLDKEEVDSMFVNKNVPKGKIHVIVNVYGLYDDSWRNENLFAPCRLPNGGNMSKVMHLMRFMCWMVSGEDDKYILCLDMVDEEFKLIELPSADHIHCGTQLADYKGSLAIFVWGYSVVQNSCIDLWVLNDCDGGTWCKQLTLRPRVINVERPLGFFTQGGVDFVILCASDEYLLWDKDSGETNNMISAKKWVSPFFVYSESFASVY